MTPAETLLRIAIREEALRHLFVPYRWGGNNPHDLGIHEVEVATRGTIWVGWPAGLEGRGGMDCSGFVLHVRRTVSGRKIPDMTAASLWKLLPKPDYNEPKVGDLLFYGSAAHPHHVVMALTKGATAIIGANRGGRPKLTDNFDNYSRRMAGRHAMVSIEDSRARGHKWRKDFVGWRDVLTLE